MADTLEDRGYSNYAKCMEALENTKEVLLGYIGNTFEEFCRDRLKILCDPDHLRDGHDHCRYQIKKKRPEQPWRINTDCETYRIMFDAVLNLQTNPNSDNMCISECNLAHDDSWVIAKAFMTPGNSTSCTRLEDTHVVDLFNILKTCKLFEPINSQLDTIIELTNKVMQNGIEHVSNEDMQDLLKSLIRLLEMDKFREGDEEVLKHGHRFMQAIETVTKLLIEESNIAMKEKLPYPSFHNGLASIEAGSDNLESIIDETNLGGDESDDDQKLETSRLFQRLRSPIFWNWVKCSIAMVLTKEALHDFVLESFVAFTESITTKRHSIAEFHRTGLQSIFYSQRSWRMKYPCTDCKDIMDDILEKHTIKTSGTIGWKNNRGSILPTDHAWVVAKVFMPHGCEKNMNPEDTDAAALFKMLFTCRLFDSIDITDREKMVRTRNALMHASDFKVDVKDMEVFFEFMINVLENEKSGLKTRKECRRTVSDLQKLKGLQFYDTQPWKSYNMARSALQISQAELTNEIEALEADTNQKDTKALKDSLRICTTELKLLSEPTAVFLGQEVMELRSTLCKKEKIITEQSVSLENTQREMQRTQKKENDSNNLLSSFNVDLQKYKDDLSRAKARNASLERNVQALEKEKETILSEKEELRQSLGAVIQDMQRQYESQDDGTKTDKKGVPETSREHRNMIDELKQHLDEFKVKR